MVITYTDVTAEERLRNPEPLKEAEARGMFALITSGVLVKYLSRVQMDLALQQIAAVNRFNKQTTTLTALAIALGIAQLVVIILLARH